MTKFYKLIGALILVITMVGCSSDEEHTLSFEETDAFMKNVFNTIIDEDFDAYLDYCVKPDDIGVNGEALMKSYEVQDGAWRKNYKRRFKNLIDKIDKTGGTRYLTWKRPGQVQGYFHDENEFVGNMYVEVTAGKDNSPMALEFGSTYKSKRGRLIGTDSGVQLLDWQQYQYQKM